MITYLSPTTGDEPFYLMTAVSIWEDHDINECNNYRERDESRLYPESLVRDRAFEFGWKGWTGAPYPLPPHPAIIVPQERRCFGSIIPGFANVIVPDIGYPLPDDGTQSELYSKHGLGLSLLVALPYALGGRELVVYFLNFLGALVAVNIYLLARQATGKMWVASLTWIAFAFTVPIFPYSFVIFPELPAALLVAYAFRRIWLGRNNPFQAAAIGLCIGILPWLHYRFVPISAGLFLFYLFRLFSLKEWTVQARLRRLILVLAPPFTLGLLLMYYFYFLYRQPLPNASDHAGSSDLAGTLRGAAGSFLDQQWGLFVAAPVFVLAIVGLVIMAVRKEWRPDLLWVGLVFLPYFVVIANYAQWWGEWCPPARYLTSVLPVLALPFSVSLGYIRSGVYNAIYGVLLLLSLAVTWGFAYQPQWMYNQPNGRSELLTKGLAVLPEGVRPRLNLVEALPSFVRPYFAYLQSPAAGDRAASEAWERSVWLFVVILAIVLVSLFLAWQRSRQEPPEEYEVTQEERNIALTYSAERDAQSPTSVQS
jgi:hypothetical protein